MLTAFAIAAATATAPILLDARCDEPAWRSAISTDVGSDVALLSMADARYVYLCVTLPPESLGTLDLYIESRDGAQTNLHVSAQTGERTRGPDGWPEWRSFNNYRGWYGPPVAFAGVVRDAGGTRPDFAVSVAREVQIERARFGAGPWRIFVQVQSLGADGSGVASFPVGGDADNARTWREFNF
ncbi:hypothetical protein U91I_01255 [alpha proteobacterium U9-1i]|nr:hypothetical protein U91I_01255 [alpha proteobacterium U9-1i]